MAKIGRPKNIESPEYLWELFQKYIIDLKEKESEWVRVQYVGKEALRMEDTLKIPLTLEGFKRFCWDIEIGCIEQYFKNINDAYIEYLPICSRIKNVIRENQLIGGMLNVFNPSITQRLNNIVERTDITTDGEKINAVTPIQIEIVKPNESDNSI